MKLREALEIARQVPASGDLFSIVLACGFTPQHVTTFLTAHVHRSLPHRRVSIEAGLYGDLAGTLEALSNSDAHGMAVILEWPDLDARLGFRAAGAWGPAAMPGILEVARKTLDRIGVAIENIPAGIPVAVALPTLPLPPVFHTPGWQWAPAEVMLDQLTGEFASHVLSRKGLLLVNQRRLAEDSPPASRFDLRSELFAGLPYTLQHTDALAAALARLLAPPLQKKGLISDLDDTMWHGIAGEIGPENVTWDLASHHQLHGLYQRLLAAFAEEGVLIGVASKNDPAVVQRTFERKDILLPPGKVFPVEAHWGAKSGSVARVLQAWSISADSVVFVDDSPMELAEVLPLIRASNACFSPRMTMQTGMRFSAGFAMSLENHGSRAKTSFGWTVSGSESRSKTRIADVL